MNCGESDVGMIVGVAEVGVAVGASEGVSLGIWEGNEEG